MPRGIGGWIGIFLSLLGPLVSHAQNQRYEWWWIVQTRVSLSAQKNLGFWFDYVRRDGNPSGQWQNIIQYFRPALEWRWSSDQWVWVGWGYLNHPLRQDGESRGYFFHFYRWAWPPVTWPLRFQHRLGLEYRHMLREQAQGWRLRWRLGIETPLRPGSPWSLSLADEVFYAWSTTIRGIADGLNENRITLGIQWDRGQFRVSLWRLWAIQDILRNNQKTTLWIDGWMLQGQMIF